MADGNIQAARNRLEIAVKRLCNPQSCVHYQHTLSAPSLYDQLVGSLAGKQGDTRTPAQSLPPAWVDALQLRAEIDAQTRKWLARSNLSTTGRLIALMEQTWRPQDTQQVTGMARTVSGWCESILHLLDPESRKYISAPCPSCGRKTVYKRDSAGEIVRQPALVVITNIGATCQHCEAHWSPDRYLFLCRLLGLELPAGVLE